MKFKDLLKPPILVATGVIALVAYIFIGTLSIKSKV